MSSRRVVVTGLGALTPIGNNVSEYWNALLSGKSGAADITRFDAEKFRTRFAAEVKGYDPKDHFDRKELRKLDPFSQYALITASEAVDHSGLLSDSLNYERVGVIWGSGIGGIQTFLDEVRSFVEGDGTPRFNPFFIPKMIIDIAAGHISMKYGFKGVNYATVSACATSSHALVEAYHNIKHDINDAIVTGGSEAAINEAAIGGFNAMRALSERNDDPSTASRPFDKDRDGFVLGEGAGSLILEELEHAKARGATIYAEVIGSGMTADAYHLTAPHPEGQGATAVMTHALNEAGIKPSEVDYINVHGTSTPLGDVAELKAIHNVFGEEAFNLVVSSTKSMTGHLLGAAGAIEAIASVLAVQNNKIPPTINHFTDDDEIDGRFNLLFHESMDREVKVAISNTFGFGGHNASLAFRKFEE